MCFLCELRSVTDPVFGRPEQPKNFSDTSVQSPKLFFSEWLNGESSLWDKNVVCKYFVKTFFTEILFYEDQHKISDNICSWSRCTKQVY